ncbi:hypothetical protein QNO00_15350 [Arthrobacter sp. zg-Y1219]|uniref:hypothetical protein n=2 Tax=Arthrobacter TaxID=1663 RepID=UPI0024C45A51|nr:hypothetical protein [Arthrobacter sp. zg-Y1219]MDK1361629.1 hypothetical protein [Arthrobacter sp. zg-Y1219]
MLQHRANGEPQKAAQPERQQTGSAEVAGDIDSPAVSAAGPAAPPAPPSAAAGYGQSQPPPPASPGQTVHPPASGADWRPAEASSRASRKHLVYGAVGLGFGLIAGIGLGQINIPFSSNAIEEAAESCSVTDTYGIDIGDNGQSISMSSEGEDSTGADYADISCLLAEMDIPDSVESRIGTTRALDGRQSADWDEFTASWGYHPDSGLNIVVEITD